MKKQHKINRRTFLGNSAKIAAAGIIFNKLNATTKKHTPWDGEIKVALVGCGGRGTGAAIQAIAADQDVRLVAIADVFEDQAEKCMQALVEKYGESEQLTVRKETIFIGFNGFKKAIDISDVVILATPPGFRPQHFSYAIEHNKHVFMEKPVATDIIGIKKVIEAGKLAVKNKLNVVVGLQRHYQRSYQKVKKLIDRGSVGRIISGQVYWNGAGVWVRPREPQQTELEYQMRNWYYFNWLCGDHIVEQHIHNIDVANWFIGATPISAQGMGGRQIRNGKDHGQIFDHHFVEFTYPKGQVISSQCRHQPGCMNRVDEVFQGSQGKVHVHSANYGLIQSHRGRKLYFHEGENDVNPYQQEHNELFAAIKKGEYLFKDFNRGVNSTLTAIMGRMATYSGKIISMEDALLSNLDIVPNNLTSFEDTAPVIPDKNGSYPIPIPGVTKFI